ncbi:sensor histidine kinase [Fulvivirgaceae bacterium PWU5]|uniref:Sensor histidine kinase n=1 Tax=Dawidia cretensis TaxID=2782350 RepID=A0AAP2E5G8_9BACT|nr:sensor histidine kinase [Dawidia cretensis]MBT1712234.1 sensor histidine kinase [Dawidia cretensis]
MRLTLSATLVLLCSATGLFAQTKLDSLHQQLQSATSDPQRAALRLQAAKELVRSDRDSAKALALEVLTWARSRHDRHTEGAAFHTVGVAEYYSSNYAEALQSYLHGLEASEAVQDWEQAAYILNDIGVFHAKQGDHEKSGKTYERALAYARRAGSREQEANSLNNLGQYYDQLNELDTARMLYESSAAIKRQMKDYFALAYNLDNIGGVLARMKRYDEAERYLMEALEYRRLYNDRNALAINLNNLGELFAMQGERHAAQKYFKEALAETIAIGYKDLRRYIYEQLAQLSEKEGDLRQALVYTRQSIALKDSIYNQQRSEQLLTLEKKFETEKKERELAESRQAVAEASLKVQGRNNTILLLGGGIFLMGAMGVFGYRQTTLKQQRMEHEAALKEQLAHAEAQNALQQERLRISRELHDNIGAQLTLINSSMDLAQGAAPNPRLEEVKKLTLSTIRELRKTVWLINKQSVSLDEFVIKFREFARPVQEAFVQFTVTVNGDGALELPSAIATAIFRVLQEAVNNSLKHSGATELRVILENTVDSLKIAVTDNGKGFTTGVAAGGFGLANMEERVRGLGGVLTVKAAPGEGTYLSFEVRM